MKTIDHITNIRDEVIAEVRRHKEAIAAEHNNDVDALLENLRERQKSNPHLVSKVLKDGASDKVATKS
ncbi:hypothetical protein OAG43_01820 [Verrucomicrobia bacterium]|nr:hypothetical protein [Verrucomicrobiota bacterium]